VEVTGEGEAAGRGEGVAGLGWVGVGSLCFLGRLFWLFVSTDGFA